jgi:hypothetical protein
VKVKELRKELAAYAPDTEVVMCVDEDIIRRIKKVEIEDISVDAVELAIDFSCFRVVIS